MGNHPSIAAAGAGGPPALVWGLDGEEELAASRALQPEGSSSTPGTAGGSSTTTSSTTTSSSSAGSNDGGVAPPDFGALFLEGEPWAEAQHRAAFLSRVQRRLLDPAFVAPLQLEEGRRAEEVGGWVDVADRVSTLH
jgi:hypothetical protein